jgi:hypothetical protein
MSFVVQRTVRGRENRAVGEPAGVENMTPGVPPPLQPIITSELGTAVSCTLARTLNVATGTATAHGLAIGDIVRIAGADQAEFNGDHRVDTVADANTFTYAVYGAVTDPATGTITCRKVV